MSQSEQLPQRRGRIPSDRERSYKLAVRIKDLEARIAAQEQRIDRLERTILNALGQDLLG